MVMPLAPADIILGNDWMKKLNAQISFESPYTCTVTVRGKGI